MASRVTTGMRVLAVGALLLVAAGCSSPRPLTVADYRMAPWRPTGVVAREGPAVGATTEVDSSPATADQTGRSGARILRPGSRVEVRLRGIPNPESFNDQVDERGEITLPHLGSVRVEGLSTSQAERHIERGYVEQRIFRSINVIITTEEEEYFVQGEVRRPGKYIVTRNLTLLQAISEAGGFTPFASRRRVRVMGEDGKVAVHNAGRIAAGRLADVPIQPKDIIDVPRKFW